MTSASEREKKDNASEGQSIIHLEVGSEVLRYPEGVDRYSLGQQDKGNTYLSHDQTLTNAMVHVCVCICSASSVLTATIKSVSLT